MDKQRFQDLAMQAGFIGTDGNTVFGTCHQTALENFAKLIAEECMRLALNGQYDEERFNPNCEFDRGVNQALQDHAIGLKNYFGLE